MARPVVVRVSADPGGVTGPTPDIARGRRWRTSSRGLYVPADVDGLRTTTLVRSVCFEMRYARDAVVTLA